MSDDTPSTRPTVRATARRAPRFGSFMLIGALGGGLIGLVLALVAPGAGAVLAVLLTLVGALALVGLLAGAVVAVVRDALSVRPRR